ncbi:hypothetical protein BU52_33145 [Streptomyces toyocaensis]|uniref:Peptidase inhibitor family I36 n=2 Tax=Streptomyces toyocaensis TaxID=55952 RepID=A0A081XHE1_STRTO|nr:hypothetical protein BU52_33145 [Streptomyces toyocaensis]
MTALAVGLLALVSFASTPAVAGPENRNNGAPALLERQARSANELQEQIDLHLKLYPGGKQTAANEITYDHGKFVATYAKPGEVQALGVPDCPSGWFCFYEYTGFGYPRGRLSDTDWQDLATYGWHDRTDSVHNNTSTAVDFENHTTGGHANDMYLFCVSSYSNDSDVSPERNMADHVYRYYTERYC